MPPRASLVNLGSGGSSKCHRGRGGFIKGSADTNPTCSRSGSEARDCPSGGSDRDWPQGQRCHREDHCECWRYTESRDGECRAQPPGVERDHREAESCRNDQHPSGRRPWSDRDMPEGETAGEASDGEDGKLPRCWSYSNPDERSRAVLVLA